VGKKESKSEKMEETKKERKRMRCNERNRDTEKKKS
jgi:hypothetical protein